MPLDFINIYKEHTCLWKVKSREYSNRKLRASAISTLKDKLQEIIPECTKEDVLKKINQ